mmetsp:Transcript_2232/g.3375  ORF Transcript_2232/g.3375 Transcript_2232/m.3375 type:complete len:105 (+) Transcript_2232:494-808(+)
MASGETLQPKPLLSIDKNFDPSSTIEGMLIQKLKGMMKKNSDKIDFGIVTSNYNLASDFFLAAAREVGMDREDVQIVSFPEFIRDLGQTESDKLVKMRYEEYKK